MQEIDEENVVEETPTFDRGTPLSIFTHDRYEDFGALLAAILLAVAITFMMK
ncbi:MAG: hypothetical protein HQL55_00300 [Magnetococcales bacterium]|nr:hypothetical protein [Magnetococcales bacterium]